MPVSISVPTGTVRVAESPQTFRSNVLLANCAIDNKNRADIAVGPVVKNYRFKRLTMSCELLRRQLADPRGPVCGRGSFAGPVARDTARAGQSCAGAAHDARAS